MKIYRKHQIQRMAAEMLCKDLMDNKNYTFTNTSYGGRGEILGTIATHDDYTRTSGTIQYRLEKNWHTDEAKLVKETELTSYKTEARPYDQQNKVETVLTLFSLNGDDIFTDDKEVATKAQEKRHQRFCLGRHDYSKDDGLSGDHEVKVGTPLYEKYADITADCSGDGIEDSVERLIVELAKC